MNRSALLVYALALCLGVSMGYRACTEHTELPSSSERYKNLLLSRRTRSVVFPKGANLLLTLALTKIILGGVPSGLQYSFEYDFYHPLPDTIEAWRPTILLDGLNGKETAKPVATLSPKLTKPKSYRRWGHRGYYHQPAAMNYHAYDQSTYSNEFGVHYNDRRRPNGFQRKFFSKSRRPLKNFNSAQSMRNAFYAIPQRFDDFDTSVPEQSSDNWGEHEAATDIGQHEAEVYESWADVPAWKFNRAYRERRALYDQFDAMGKLLNLNMSACIKRAMCEFNAQILLSLHGKSGLLMVDLVHIILNIPEGIDSDEKYKPQHGKSRSMEDCARLYSVSCPYRVFDFLSKHLAIVK